MLQRVRKRQGVLSVGANGEDTIAEETKANDQIYTRSGNLYVIKNSGFYYLLYRRSGFMPSYRVILLFYDPKEDYSSANRGAQRKEPTATVTYETVSTKKLRRDCGKTTAVMELSLLGRILKAWKHNTHDGKTPSEWLEELREKGEVNDASLGTLNRAINKYYLKN